MPKCIAAVSEERPQTSNLRKGQEKERNVTCGKTKIFDQEQSSTVPVERLEAKAGPERLEARPADD